MVGLEHGLLHLPPDRAQPGHVSDAPPRLAAAKAQQKAAAAFGRGCLIAMAVFFALGMVGCVLAILSGDLSFDTSKKPRPAATSAPKKR
jgi:hypothetical protein